VKLGNPASSKTREGNRRGRRTSKGKRKRGRTRRGPKSSTRKGTYTFFGVQKESERIERASMRALTRAKQGGGRRKKPKRKKKIGKHRLDGGRTAERVALARVPLKNQKNSWLKKEGAALGRTIKGQHIDRKKPRRWKGFYSTPQRKGEWKTTIWKEGTQCRKKKM